MHQPPKDLRQFQSLVQIMTTLRSPTGCPWDQEQTHESLASYAIEEAHELAEAIESGKTADVIEELGDLLLQVVFHAELGRLSKTFTLEDVIESINTKMVQRHPHVFGDVQVRHSNDVLENWSKIKEQEKKKKGQTETSPFKMPPSLPALQKASKIGQKTKQSKFDWPDVSGVRGKLTEELNELDETLDKVVPADQLLALQSEQSHEIGDVLFTVAQLARHLDIDAEQALRKTNARFEKRYVKMLEIAREQNRDWNSLTDAQKEKLWSQAKAATNATT